MSRPCAVDGCDGAVRAYDYCRGHYNRWKIYGDPYPEVPLGSGRVVASDPVAVMRVLAGDPPKVLHSVDLMAAIEAMADVPASVVARRAGCTVRTVERYRARLREAAL